MTSDTGGGADGAVAGKAPRSGRVTQVSAASVEAFDEADADDRRRADAEVLLDLFGRATGQPAEMWGPSIVGFGRVVLQQSSGEQEWLATGFSPRARQLSIYLMDGTEAHPELLARLGKHRTGRGCLYVTRLDDVDLGVLEGLVRVSYRAVTGAVAVSEAGGA